MAADVVEKRVVEVAAAEAVVAAAAAAAAADQATLPHAASAMSNERAQGACFRDIFSRLPQTWLGPSCITPPSRMDFMALLLYVSMVAAGLQPDHSLITATLAFTLPRTISP